MMSLSCDFKGTMQKDMFRSLSSDVRFTSNKFPSYKIGADNRIEDSNETVKTSSLKEIVARETMLLLEQQKRLSVRDLASKFEKGLATPEKLTGEAKVRDAASLDDRVLLKNLRDALESLRGRVAGRNRDDVEEAIVMVEALAVQLTQRERKLLQENLEVKKLASLLKQTSEDAKKMVDEERNFARAEIEHARAAVQRVEEALHEHENNFRNSGLLDLEKLTEEVQEARRIKMLHQPSKVMDMEFELQALRVQLAEKSMHSLLLKKELAESKRNRDGNRKQLYELDGFETLGSCLNIIPCIDNAPDFSSCSVQWFRMLSDGSRRERISGAMKPVYAPEPFDVGRFLEVEIISKGVEYRVKTTGPIDHAAGLESYVESLARKSDIEFNVVITQMNGEDHSSNSVHTFHVGKMRTKISKGRTTKVKEPYSASMLLCGIRGGGNAATQAAFWQPRNGISFTLAFESARERNAAIMLARRFAFDCNVTLVGPGDGDSLRT